MAEIKSFSADTSASEMWRRVKEASGSSNQKAPSGFRGQGAIGPIVIIGLAVIGFAVAGLVGGGADEPSPRPSIVAAAPGPDGCLDPAAFGPTSNTVPAALTPDQLSRLLPPRLEGEPAVQEWTTLTPADEAELHYAAEGWEEALEEFGFSGGAWRKYGDDPRSWVEAEVQVLPDAEAAATFTPRVDAVDCPFVRERFASVMLGDAAWGTRVHLESGAVEDQIAWTRDGYRYAVTVRSPVEEPDTSLVDEAAVALDRWAEGRSQ